MKTRVLTRQVVELDDEAVKEVFAKELLRLCGGEDMFLKDDGTVWETDDYGHGSPIEDRFEHPTEVQVCALRLKNALKKQAADEARFEKNSAREVTRD